MSTALKATHEQQAMRRPVGMPAEIAAGPHGLQPAMPTLGSSPIPDALADIAAGRLVIVVDDEGRENEGDLCVAAELVTPEQIAFMARHASGLICTAMTGERLDELGLGPAVAHNTSLHTTAFTVSVEAANITTTGISAHDRAATARQLVNPQATAADFVRPGHMFPLRAAEGGVLCRDGHTEAAVDLARLAGLAPAGVICEIMNDDGTMARAADLAAFAERHDIRLITVRDLVAYRRCTEPLVARRARCALPLNDDVWEAHAFEHLYSGESYLALTLGDVAGGEPVLVRAHSGCLTGDVFGSQRCDCGKQLETAIEQISAVGCGVILYFPSHEGRGIGLVNKLKAYQLQEQGLDTVQANMALHQPVDSRDYGSGASMLRLLGVTEIRVLTNNPAKLQGLECHGVRVVERVPLQSEPTAHNSRYLRTKQQRLGHLL